MVAKLRIIERNINKDSQLSSKLHPVLRRIYLARNIVSDKQTENSLRYLLPFESLMGIHDAVSLLVYHLQNERRILIVGDYDADGATSCALAIRALKAMGCRYVDYLVPNRFDYGYGLTPEIVEVAKQYKPDLIITVDNGIASIDGVKYAKESGMQVLITDHHLPGDSLPEADAILNPNQVGDSFPSKNLAGVGVIFYLMAALRAQLRKLDWFHNKAIPEPNLADFLDLVALGTVADVVKLDHNNRILVSQGLARIRAGQACHGIKSLLKVAGRDPVKAISTDMGFFVGPRLNAAGRLDDMSIGIECLLADSDDDATEKAKILDQFNRERREIEQTMREQATVQLEQIINTADQNTLPNALCLFDPKFHEGVIGILAGRLKDEIHRPVVIFAKSSDGLIKGSARSIPGLHIRDALDRVATDNPGLLTKFGGHAMAAGLTLRETDFERFNIVFNQVIGELVDEDELQRVMHTDGKLTGNEISLELAELLRNAGPWGQGFPEPQFEGEFELIQRRVVGEHHLKMLVKTGKQHIDAIAFRSTDQGWPEQVESVKLVYKLDINEFNGQRSTQFVVDYVKPIY